MTPEEEDRMINAAFKELLDGYMASNHRKKVEIIERAFKFAKDAPVHILIVEESMNITSFLGSKIKDKYFPLIDIGIAAAHIALAAESEGLGSCILGWFDEKDIKSLVGIPAGKRLLLDVVVGYAAKPKRKKSRKDLGKVVSYNHY